MTFLSISSSQVREWELAAEKSGISSLTLMENAGQRTAEFIRSYFPESHSILIVCGSGNNAGDGFVTARCLYGLNRHVEILLLAGEAKLKGAAKINFEKLKKLGIEIRRGIPSADLKSYDLIVDAIFGIGMTREASGVFHEAIEAVNASGRPVIAVDIPSGLDADTGEVLGVAVRALHTLTLGAFKHGLLKGQGPFCAGTVTVLDIGLPLRPE